MTDFDMNIGEELRTRIALIKRLGGEVEKQLASIAATS